MHKITMKDAVTTPDTEFVSGKKTHTVRIEKLGGGKAFKLNGSIYQIVERSSSEPLIQHNQGEEVPVFSLSERHLELLPWGTEVEPVALAVHYDLV